ncbi:MAG: DNA-binding GntR family transcriptional regulator [Candidatus Promineifilaceae bacterium]|jgi:DNA-binding GntR family transcriptional regulator
MTLTNETYNFLKHKIVSLEYPPNCVINEATLVSELKIGRTPIREALQRLERDKLVTIMPRRGTFVTEISLSDLPQIFDNRILLESYIAKLASQRGTPEQWDKMELILEKITAKGESATLEELVQADRECHEIMFAVANQKYLHDTLIMLYAQTNRLWYAYTPQTTLMQLALDDHWAILAALRDKNSDLASELLHGHIHKIRHEVQAVMMAELTA